LKSSLNFALHKQKPRYYNSSKDIFLVVVLKVFFRFKHPLQDQITGIEIKYDQTQTPPKFSILSFDSTQGTKPIVEIDEVKSITKTPFYY